MEERIEKLSSEYSHQHDAAELQQLRALAEQQWRWEAREESMEEFLSGVRHQQQQEQSEEKSEKLILQAREEVASVYEQRLQELQQIVLESEERERSVTAELVEKNRRLEKLNCQVADLADIRTKKAEAGPISREEVNRSSEAVAQNDGVAPRCKTLQTSHGPPPLIHVPVDTAAFSVQGEGESATGVPASATYTHYNLPTQQIALQVLSGLTHQLPNLLEYTGEDEKRDGSFAEWLKRFEMVAELAECSDIIKLKQLILCLRGSAQTFYRTCSEEKTTTYSALTYELSQRFTPVRIQALECSVFHERKQKSFQTVDEYAQELQRLFQKAYPSAALGSEDAHKMGQAVLSSQFVGGLNPDIKRKVAYIEGATFSELWQKARFEEV